MFAAMCVAAPATQPADQLKPNPRSYTIGHNAAPATQPAATQPAAARLPNDAAILKALDAKDYFIRQQATDQLLQDKALTLGRLKHLYSRATSLEQRHRLLNVARHWLLRQAAKEAFPPPGTGALGLSHRALPAGAAPGLDRAAVEVLATLPGFPAYAWLHPGDLITGINGRPLTADTTAEGFRLAIQNLQDGDAISLNVHRRGKDLTVRFTLGSGMALGAMYIPGNLQLTPDFLAKWAALRQTLTALGPKPTTIKVEKN